MGNMTVDEIVALAQRLDDENPTDVKVGFETLMMRLATIAEMEVMRKAGAFDLADAEDSDEYADALASIILIAAHAAEENGLDIEAALRSRVDDMNEEADRDDAIRKAMDEADVEAFAAIVEEEYDAPADEVVEAEDVETKGFY